MRVLIAEDDESMAGSLRRGLTDEGYLVDFAHDGSEGLVLALDVDAASRSPFVSSHAGAVAGAAASVRYAAFSDGRG